MGSEVLVIAGGIGLKVGVLNTEVISWMKKYSIIKAIIIAFPFIFFGPLFINLSFKYYLSPMLSSEWAAGDLLAYYGAVLGGIITLVGVSITLNYQSEMSRRDDDVKYKPILRLDSVLGEYAEFIARRELKVLYPYSCSLADDNEYENLSSRPMEDMYSFHLIFENKGRGEATDITLYDAKISEVSWDKASHLYIATGTPMSLGELIIDERVDIILSIPKLLFLKEEQEYGYNIRIDILISYNNMFQRNQKQINISSDFQVIPRKKSESSYYYKEGFSLYEVEIKYIGSQQIK